MKKTITILILAFLVLHMSCLHPLHRSVSKERAMESVKRELDVRHIVLTAPLYFAGKEGHTWFIEVHDVVRPGESAYVVEVDAETGRVIYFLKIFPLDRDPMDHLALDEKIRQELDAIFLSEGRRPDIARATNDVVSSEWNGDISGCIEEIVRLKNISKEALEKMSAVKAAIEYGQIDGERYLYSMMLEWLEKGDDAVWVEHLLGRPDHWGEFCGLQAWRYNIPAGFLTVYLDDNKRVAGVTIVTLLL